MVHGDLSECDPRGLMREAYRIEGISEAECRSIFLDWVLGIDDTIELNDGIEFLLHNFGKNRQSHPMTKILVEGLEMSARPKRRRGRSR